jgi:hypothetical protein
VRQVEKVCDMKPDELKSCKEFITALADERGARHQFDGGPITSEPTALAKRAQAFLDKLDGKPTSSATGPEPPAG